MGKPSEISEPAPAKRWRVEGRRKVPEGSANKIGMGEGLEVGSERRGEALVLQHQTLPMACRECLSFLLPILLLLLTTFWIFFPAA